MYTGYFKFRQEPFRITPDPGFLYLSPSHKEALAAIVYGVKQRKGFVAIVGEVGVGKTTILRAFLEKIDNSHKVVYIFNPKMSFKALLQTIYHNLGRFVEYDDPTELLNELYHILVHEYQKGNNVVVVIDEAQNMPLKTLESLRMLSNLETTTDKLVQVVFSGQPEFETLLDRQELRQLRQRIGIKARIRPLTTQESIAYIRHRLAKASGGQADDIFTARTLARLVKVAGGIPRTINILCDNCLITSYGHQQTRVTPSVLKEICSDLGMRHSSSALVRVAVLLVVLCSACVLWLQVYHPWQADMKPGVVRVSEQELPVRSATPAVQQVTHPDPAAPEPAEIKDRSGDITEHSDQRLLVRKGDTLANLVSRHYGTVSYELLQSVTRSNPEITDPNKIVEGQRLLFPARNQ